MGDITEADEAAEGSKAWALRRLEEQAGLGETLGVVAMYERAARELGATTEEREAAIRRGIARAAGSRGEL